MRTFGMITTLWLALVCGTPAGFAQTVSPAIPIHVPITEVSSVARQAPAVIVPESLNENAWDFNDAANQIPGFGSMTPEQVEEALKYIGR